MSSEKSTNDAAEINLLDDGMSAERARNAKGTALRLLKKLMEQRWKLLVVSMGSIIISSVFTVLSPKLIGIAINQIFNGIQSAAAGGGPFRVSFETMGLSCWDWPACICSLHYFLLFSRIPWPAFPKPCHFL